MLALAEPGGVVAGTAALEEFAVAVSDEVSPFAEQARDASTRVTAIRFNMDR